MEPPSMDTFKAMQRRLQQRLNHRCVGVDAKATIATTDWRGNEVAHDHAPCGAGSPDVRLIGLTSSRLGDDATRRRLVCQHLSRLMIDDRDAVFVVAMESAIDAWATRAAELYDATLLRIGFADEEVQSSSRKDELLIQVADVVEAAYVRRGGAIAKAIESRLKCDTAAEGTVRVVMSQQKECHAARLVQHGAVGRWTRPDVKESVAGRRSARSEPSTHDFDWAHSPDDWLVHCTRGRDQPWPGQSEHQWMDDWLLSDGSDDGHSLSGPLATLRRIISSRRLIASAVTSSHAHRVVCFSAAALSDLLSRRIFRKHVRRWDYEPFGVAIRRGAAVARGVCEVVYGPKSEQKTLPMDQRFRFQAISDKIDWTAEREYRSARTVNLDDFDRSDVRVFVPESCAADTIRGVCPWAIFATSDILPLSRPNNSHASSTSLT